jgi:hypothetical protein
MSSKRKKKPAPRRIQVTRCEGCDRWVPPSKVKDGQCWWCRHGVKLSRRRDGKEVT